MASPNPARIDERRSAGDIADLSDLAQNPTVERAVEAMREFLGMDVAFTTEWRDGQQHFHVVRGDPASFHLHEGMGLPLEMTYCKRVMDGRLPNIVTDARADERAASLPITEFSDVGSFVSIPLRFSDGRLYGTLCAGSHEARPDLGYRELQFLHVFARLVSDVLERTEIEAARLELELQRATATTLFAAVEARDAYTGEHAARVVGRLRRARSAAPPWPRRSIRGRRGRAGRAAAPSTSARSRCRTPILRKPGHARPRRSAR